MLSRKLLIGFSLLLFLILVFMGLNWLSQPAHEVITEKGFEGILFTKENALDVLRYELVNEKTEEEYWTPTKRISCK